MYSFLNDYSEGGHERILDTLVRINREQDAPYGLDKHSEHARALIQARLDNPDSRVHFLTGGTQANLVLITAALRPHQGVIAAQSGHINVHETGAIEAAGHKVIALAHTDGKLDAKTVEDCFSAHEADVSAEHGVQPAMVYVSNPTELGTLYSLSELSSLFAVCRRHGARMYLDGARLGCALVAEGSDVTLSALARVTSAFTIGGTKMGAITGEALVINEPALDKDFRYIMKQRGAMPAKGRLLGVQFEELMKDGLYEELARHAVETAQFIAKGLKQAGYAFLVDSPTNQIFPIFSKEELRQLGAQFEFSFWQSVDEKHDAVRLCCSWATPLAQAQAFLDAVSRL